MRKAAVILTAMGLGFLAVGPADARYDGAASYRRAHASAWSTMHAAERGNARAQAILGFMYEHGRSVPQDFRRAAKWYYRAAEQGEPHGQHFLGLLYDKGRGVPQDYIEAYKWLNLAAARAGRRDRDYYIRMRNALASKMTLAAIDEAQARARAWQPVRAGW